MAVQGPEVGGLVAHNADDGTDPLIALQALPAAIRELPQWLLWRYEKDPKRDKPLKVPYYANGHRRGGKRDAPLRQGSPEDRAALVSFDIALRCLRSNASRYSGMGFAFLPGDGLIGIDVDGAIDAETGEVSELCSQVIERCASYTERSPSGKGVHIIVRGETATFKDNGIGLEVFAGRQYFTCTGTHWSGSPATVERIADDALAWLRKTVDDAKARARAKARDQAAQPPAPAPAPATATPPPPAATGPADDFRRVNDAGIRALHAWVPQLFPYAISHTFVSGQGYRVRSKDLGRELQEDISITPDGIVDFGVADMGDARDGRRTPIDLVMEWQRVGSKEALHWLAHRVGVQLSKSKLRLVPAAQPPDGDEPPPSPHPEETGAAGGGGGRRNARPKGEGGDGLERLREHYALIYGTDTVWDGETRRVMKVANLRLIFGNDDVKAWLRDSERRRVVLPEHLVFEPGKEVPEDHINLFDGFAMEPVACTQQDVAPMLELLWHLCSMSASTKAGIRAVFDQVLRWIALPLQRPGAKVRFALLFHGPQGTGKNLFFDGVRSIYGKYGRMVGQTELEDKFNDWLSAKLMIIGNEVVTRQELYHHKNKLKWLITEDEIPIRGMQQSVRWESNHANVVFLSNEQQPLALEKDDRRYLVIYTPAAREDDLYRRVAVWLDGGGAAKFLHYLLNLDLGDFDEHSKPLMTEAKESLIELGLKPAERFMNEWLHGLLPLAVNVCSAEQLYRVFRRWCDQTGERFPPPQAVFTKQCERHVLETVERNEEGARLDPRLRYKVVALKDDQGTRKAVRCWLPRGTGPLPGISEGEWAWSAVEAFELAVSRYGRSHVSAEEPPP
jgi:hypothetical protein